MKTLLGIAMAASQVKVLREDMAWDCIGSQSRSRSCMKTLLGIALAASQVKVKVLHEDLALDCIGSQSSQGQGLA